MASGNVLADDNPTQGNMSSMTTTTGPAKSSASAMYTHLLVHGSAL